MRYHSQPIHMFRHGLEFFMSGVWDSIQFVASACSRAIFAQRLVSPLQAPHRRGAGQHGHLLS